MGFHVALWQCASTWIQTVTVTIAGVCTKQSDLNAMRVNLVEFFKWGIWNPSLSSIFSSALNLIKPLSNSSLPLNHYVVYFVVFSEGKGCFPCLK